MTPTASAWPSKASSARCVAPEATGRARRPHLVLTLTNSGVGGSAQADKGKRSRGAEACSELPLVRRGRGECRAPAAPMASRHSPRWFSRLWRAPRCPACSHRHQRDHHPPRIWCQPRGASLGAPGPRVFTSATCRSSARPEERAATDRGHRIPRSTVRDDRETPLQRARDGVEHRSDLPDDTSVAACDRVARRAICAGLGCGASRHGTSPASTETAAMGQGPTLMLAVRHRP